MIVVVTVVVVLALCGVGGTVAVLLVNGTGGSGDGTTTRMVTPETLAGRPRITNPELQQQLDQTMRSVRAGVPGITGTVSAAYGDVSKRDLITVLGGLKRFADPADDLDDIVRGIGSGEVKVSGMVAVGPGPLGGVAKCGDLDVRGVAVGLCVWVDRASFGLVHVYFRTAEQAEAEFIAIRAAVEQRS
jgi:hypothetical protein